MSRSTLHTLRLLSLASILAACAPSAPAARSAEPPQPDPSASVPATPPTAPDPAPEGRPRITGSFSGLMKLPGLAALPEDHAFVKTPGYPGSGFRHGVFRNPDSLAAFVKAAGLTKVPAVEWNHEVVAFVVLDAQTNALAVGELTAEGDAGILTVRHSLIEPYYEGATPIALAVVRLGKVERLSFRVVPEGGGAVQELGSVLVSSE